MGKKIKMALQVPLADVIQVSLSPDAGNQVLIIGFRGSNNDLVIYMAFWNHFHLLGF